MTDARTLARPRLPCGVSASRALLLQWLQFQPQQAAQPFAVLALAVHFAAPLSDAGVHAEKLHLQLLHRAPAFAGKAAQVLVRHKVVVHIARQFERSQNALVQPLVLLAFNVQLRQLDGGVAVVVDQDAHQRVGVRIAFDGAAKTRVGNFVVFLAIFKQFCMPIRSQQLRVNVLTRLELHGGCGLQALFQHVVGRERRRIVEHEDGAALNVERHRVLVILAALDFIAAAVDGFNQLAVDF